MPRPIRCRRIMFRPDSTYFKPVGIPLRNLKENVISLDEAEALRLIDLEEAEQKEACKKMDISQPTLSRLLKNGREKISDALINGKAIRIKGGNFEYCE